MSRNVAAYSVAGASAITGMYDWHLDARSDTPDCWRRRFLDKNTRMIQPKGSLMCETRTCPD